MVKIAGVLAAGYENGVGGKAGPAVHGAVGGGGGKGNVHGTGFQKAQHLGAAAADDLQPDAGMLAVEGLQIRGQEKARHCVRGADGQRAQQQLLSLGQLVLSGGDEAQGAADILVEHLPFSGQRDAPGTAGE